MHYAATGQDVDTVVVDGEVVMEGRTLLRVDEAEIIEVAKREAQAMLDRTGLRALTATPESFWADRYDRAAYSGPHEKNSAPART